MSATATAPAARPMLPAALPAQNANFIAYGPLVRNACPITGEVLPVRPQVYVRYYTGILIKQLVDGGINGAADLVTVKFDPESVGLKQNISAHMDADDPTVPLLREAFAKSQPVAVGIETQRKVKNKTSREAIGPFPHIHALRAANGPDGSGDNSTMMGPSGENTANRLALVNGMRTKHTITDPGEWADLVANKDGRIPPEGYRVHAPGEDWKVMCITPKDGVAPARPGQEPRGTGNAPDADMLASLIESIMTRVLEERDAENAGRPGSTREEGKPWEVRTRNGHVNLGGYIVTAERNVFTWAFEHLTAVDAAKRSSAAWALNGIIMEAADKVQVAAYGTGTLTAPDRTAQSHREAEKWVQWVIEHQHNCHDGDATEEWGRNVVTAAVAFLRKAGENTSAYLATLPKKTPEAPEAPTGPAPAVIQAILDTITDRWDSSDSLLNLGRTATEKGHDEVVVGAARANGEAPTLTFPPVDGAAQVTIRQVLATRLSELQQVAPAEPQPQQAPAAEQAPAPVATPAPAQQQQTASAPTTAPTPVVAVSASSVTALRDVARALMAAKTTQDTQNAYNAAKAGNILAAPVRFRITADGVSVAPVTGPTPDGFRDGALHEAILEVKNHLSAASAPQAQPTPQETAPQAQPTPQAAQPTMGRTAQEIADQAGQQTTPDAIVALHREAEHFGLLGKTITVGTNSGALGSYLDSILKRLTRPQR